MKGPSKFSDSLIDYSSLKDRLKGQEVFITDHLYCISKATEPTPAADEGCASQLEPLEKASKFYLVSYVSFCQKTSFKNSTYTLILLLFKNFL